MKTNYVKIVTAGLLFTMFSIKVYSQDRIEAPRKDSKIYNVDVFVNKTFELYNTVYTLDSLTKKGIDINEKYEDAFLEQSEKDIQQLYNQIPDMVEEISNAKFLKQAKATMNLNKARKALTFCMEYAKSYLIGE